MSDSKEAVDVGLKKVFESLFALKHFCLPAQVISFNKALQTVNVQPALKTLALGETIPELLPIQEDVPVVYPGGGTFFVTFDILPGAFVLLVFAERSIENWMNLGGLGDPQSTRKCDLSDAIAIPGLLPTPNVLVPGVTAAALTLRNKLGTSTVELTDTEITITTPGSSVVAGAASVDLNGSADFAVAYNDLKVAFDSLKGELNALITAYNAHIHVTTATVGPSAVPGVITATTSQGVPAAADMSAAQVPTVKLP